MKCVTFILNCERWTWLCYVRPKEFNISKIDKFIYIYSKVIFTYEPGHEKMCLMSYANNRGADQPAHPHSLISAFFVRCLDSIISLDSIAEISRL